MKKIVFSLLLLLFVSTVFGGTGSIEVYPKQVPRDYFGATIEVIFMPDSGVVWNNGKLIITIPQAFYPAPTLTTGAQGTLKAYRMVSGTTPLEIPPSNILIDGYIVTINSIAISASDTVKIVYGYSQSAGEGVQTPNIPGDYYFECLENPTGISSNTLVPSGRIRVSDVAITKTANKAQAIAGDTITYTITFSNISPYHPSQDVTVWDTIPDTLELIETSSVPANVYGKMYVWEKSMLMISDPVTMAVVAKVKPDAVYYANTVTNTAEINAWDMYGYNYQNEDSVSLPVYGVKLGLNLMTMPSSSAVQGQQITVILRVENTGNTFTPYCTAALNPTNANVIMISNPSPSYRSISPSAFGMFTWVYEAANPGIVAFSASASAQSGYSVINSSLIVSNNIIISGLTPTFTGTTIPSYTPTSTYTEVYTSTFTPTFTKTQTPVNTVIFTGTVVPSDTATFMPSFTATLTKTPEVQPSFTPVPQQSPLRTPDIPVYTDKNVFNPANNEKINITCRLPYSSKARAWVYNLNGEVVAELINTEASGTVSIFWDGRNQKGALTGRGIYFIHVKQGDWQTIKKVIVLK